MRQAQQGSGRRHVRRADGQDHRRQRPAAPGKTLVATHIDSWEDGSQNWTPRLREEFRKRRGYDLCRYLPVMTGRVVDSLEISERFLWDLRQTISELLVENYAGHFRELAHKHGLRLSIEAYGDGPLRRHGLRRAGRRADGRVLVVALWRHARQLHGDDLRRPRLRQADLGAEAFTATDGEKWQGHPANIKTWATGPSARASTASSSTATRCSRGSTRGPACRWAPGACTTSGPRPGGSSRRPGTSTWPAARSCCGKGCSWPTSATCSPKDRRAAIPAAGGP